MIAFSTSCYLPSVHLLNLNRVRQAVSQMKPSVSGIGLNLAVLAYNIAS